jgi:hypothetical protein
MTRSWNTDSRTLNSNDARQVVACYRATYSPRRFQWLMLQAAGHGHQPDVAHIFQAAVEEAGELLARIES